MSELVKSSAFAPANISDAWRISEGLSKSEMIPKDFQNKPHNVMVAMMVSHDIGLSPFTVMQNLCVIHGRPRWFVKFLIAQANRAGIFSAPIDWRVTGKGKDLVVEAYATLKANGVTVSVSCSLAEASAEGWTRNPKYATMPEQMLRWRSAGRLIDLYCPEVSLGIKTEVDEEEVSSESEQINSAQNEPAVLPPATRRPGRPPGARNRPKPTEPREPIQALAGAPTDGLFPDDVPADLTGSELVGVAEKVLTADEQAAIARLEGQIWEWRQSDSPEREEKIAFLRNEQARIRHG